MISLKKVIRNARRWQKIAAVRLKEFLIQESLAR